MNKILAFALTAVLAATLAPAARAADCDAVWKFNKIDSEKQLVIFNETDPAKKEEEAKDAQLSTHAAMQSYANTADTKPTSNCGKEAFMYYYLANTLHALNGYEVFKIWHQTPDVVDLEAYIGTKELTLDLYKRLLHDTVKAYKTMDRPVPPNIARLATKYSV